MGALNEGKKKAEEKMNVKWNWIIDIPRSHPECADDTTDIVLSAGKKNSVVALGLGGNEVDFPAKLFTQHFERAVAGGIASIPHGGELCGPESIWDCINLLKAHRIGHGVRCIEDLTLVEYLVKSQIPLEVCPTSNVLLSIFKNYRSHPLRRLWDAGVFLTVNSDDPSLFNCSLSDEYEVLVREFGFTVSEIETIALNSVYASLLNDEEKEKLCDLIMLESLKL